MSTEPAQQKTAARAATVPAAARVVPSPAVIQRSAVVAPLVVQTAAQVSSPSDPAEKEAESTAKKIMRMPAAEAATQPSARFESPYIARFAGSGIFSRREHAADFIRRKSDGTPDVGSNVQADIQRSISGGGNPLPASVRRFMEPRFGANFSNVKVHTGDNAARLSTQLSAQAFTVGQHVFFGRDRFQPDTRDGRELIAHELTHTVQQGSVVQRREDVSVSQHVPVHIQRLGMSDVLGFFADRANAIPGYRMFTIILGVNPINMARVDRNAANILRAVVEFLPGGNLITMALDNYGVFERVGNWVEQQIRTLGMTGSIIRDALNRFLGSLSWTDVLQPGDVWARARRIFSDPIDRIIVFVRGTAVGILRFIKDAVLRPLAALAQSTRGWDLLCAVLGQNPITGDAVPRNAQTLIGGFMRLIGQEEVWNNIQRANAIPRAWTWFQSALGELMGFVRQIPSMFLQALQTLEIADMILLPRAFLRVGRVFADFLGRYISWAGSKVLALLEIIFEVLAPSVMPYLRRAGGAFRTILQNPIAFIGNLVRAGIQGFRQFAANFLTHLRGSLIAWLTGTLAGANIYIPQAFTVREIIKFVLSVLGLTWQNIRQKLVRVVGETAVVALETGFDIVVTLVTQGPAAAWEKIVEAITNLREMVMEQIMTFVGQRIVQAAITRLITSLNPAGAFIQAILAIYNTVMFVVERLSQIGQVVAAYIDSIAAIASGAIGAAANRVEQTMAGLLTLVISFLARLVGLGNVSDAVTNIVNRIRAPIDRALDRAVEWIVATARRLGRLVAAGGRAVAGAVMGWLRHRGSFRSIDGQDHSLYFEKNGNQIDLIRASDPKTEILTYLETLEYPSTDSRAADLKEAKVLAGDLHPLTRTPAPGQAATSPKQEADIIKIIARLSKLLIRLVNMSIADLPRVAGWSRAKSNTAHYSRVDKLSSHSAKGGSAAEKDSPEYEFLVAAEAKWVRMHLIGYAVGGAGEPANWVPAPINVNSGGPVRSFEIALEKAVRSAAIPDGKGMRAKPKGAVQPNVVWVETEVTGFRPPMVDARGRKLYFPSGVLMKFGLYRPDGTDWVKFTAPLSEQSVTIPPPPVNNRISLSSSSGTAMLASGLRPFIDSEYGNRLIHLIKETRGAGFGTFEALESRLEAATQRARVFRNTTISAIVKELRTLVDI